MAENDVLLAQLQLQLGGGSESAALLAQLRSTLGASAPPLTSSLPAAHAVSNAVVALGDHNALDPPPKKAKTDKTPAAKGPAEDVISPDDVSVLPLGGGAEGCDSEVKLVKPDPDAPAIAAPTGAAAAAAVAPQQQQRDRIARLMNGATSNLGGTQMKDPSSVGGAAAPPPAAWAPRGLPASVDCGPPSQRAELPLQDIRAMTASVSGRPEYLFPASTPTPEFSGGFYDVPHGRKPQKVTSRVGRLGGHVAMAVRVDEYAALRRAHAAMVPGLRKDLGWRNPAAGGAPGAWLGADSPLDATAGAFDVLHVEALASLVGAGRARVSPAHRAVLDAIAGLNDRENPFKVCARPFCRRHAHAGPSWFRRRAPRRAEDPSFVRRLARWRRARSHLSRHRRGRSIVSPPSGRSASVLISALATVGTLGLELRLDRRTSAAARSRSCRASTRARPRRRAAARRSASTSSSGCGARSSGCRRTRPSRC